MPSLHIVFVVKGRDADDLLNGLLNGPQWSAPSTAKRGDVALFYVGGAGAQAVYAVGRTAEDAEPGEKAPHWGRSKTGKGFFAAYEDIALLDVPLGLEVLRRGFPRWEAWSVLRGRRVHTVPEEYRAPLAKWICSESPRAAALLKPWLRGGGRAPSVENPELDETRYEGTRVTRQQVVYERDAKNRALALASSRPPYTCIVCGFNFEKAYGAAGKGYIEVHHKRPVSHGRRKAKATDLAVLCANCHTMAHWRSGEVPRSISDLQTMWKENGRRAGRRSR